jgi:hypothetical protein
MVVEAEAVAVVMMAVAGCVVAERLPIFVLSQQNVISFD